jgi:hypothetical protein
MLLSTSKFTEDFDTSLSLIGGELVNESVCKAADLQMLLPIGTLNRKGV